MHTTSAKSHLEVIDQDLSSKNLAIISMSTFIIIGFFVSLSIALVPSSIKLIIGSAVVFSVTFFVWKKPTISIFLLLGLLPFHSLLMRILAVDLGLSNFIFVISMWKEYILFVVFLRLIFLRRHFYLIHLDILIFCFALFNIFFIFINDSLTAGFYGYRGNIEPFFFYIVARYLQPTTARLNLLIRIMLTTGLFTSVFGFGQVFWLGHSFLSKYYTENGIIDNSHFAYIGGRFQIRANSTFTSPNDFGMFLAIILLIGVGLFLTARRPKATTWLLVVSIMLPALLLTFSRSSWLALGTGFLSVFLLRRRIKTSLLLSILFVILLSIPVLVKLDIFQRFSDTISLQDPSAAGKLPSIINGAKFVLDHPMGIGLGMAGPRSGRFGEVEIHSENYYILMAMEIGIIGLILYLVIIIATVFMLHRSYSISNDIVKRGFTIGTLLALIGASFGVIFIPTLQEIVISSILWFAIGMSVQRSTSNGNVKG